MDDADEIDDDTDVVSELVVVERCASVDGVELWRQLQSATDSLSQQLCEQLRILLEPQLAARLGGAFRTGKRLNMRRVIAYIASSFRRDRIWTRRARPSHRRYQVALAIDDSRSMLANGAGRLALQALSAITQALTRLDAANLQLALLSFGERVTVLHDFATPFSDAAAADAVAGFTFGQRETRFGELLERSLRLMDASRCTDAVQLLFVISDARVQQDRAKLARWTRRALANRQLLVLIVIDSADDGSSIVNLKSVSYPDGKLKVVDYLDEFPFPYYVILRRAVDLPSVVADALRQWFELIQRQ